MDNAFNKEYYYNWYDAYTLTLGSNVPPKSDVLASNVVYKMDTNEEVSRSLKVRIVPHGNNHGREKDNIRKDSASVQLNIIRLVLSISTILNLELGTTDIKGA